MHSRLLVLSCAAVLLCGPGFLAVALGQNTERDSDSWSAARTADGQPDLQGVWANNSATPLERPDVLGERTHLTDEEVATLQLRASELFNGETDAAFGGSVFETVLAGSDEYQSGDGVTNATPDGTGNYNQFWLVDRKFGNRTSLIVDPTTGKLPATTAEANRREETAGAYRIAHPADSHRDRSPDDRCITYGVPRTNAGYNSYFQIFQSSTHVAILQEMIHEVRLVPIVEQPPLAKGIRQYTGNSRGYWEGDTLVVETSNFSPDSNVRGATEHVTTRERFSLVSPDQLDWEVTFTDSHTWSRPWTMMISLSKTDDAIFEYACHEGNYSMEGILSGHRAEERAVSSSIE
jgi:hypothetical protein